MGVCKGQPAGRAVVYSVGQSGRAAQGEFQHTGTGEHSMGIFDGGPARRAAVRGVDQGDTAERERLQRARPRQHSMGVCDGSPVECACGLLCVPCLFSGWDDTIGCGSFFTMLWKIFCYVVEDLSTMLWYLISCAYFA